MSNVYDFISYENISRSRVEDDRDSTRRAYLALEHAIKAEAIAEVIMAFCPHGEDVPYKKLKRLHDTLRGQA